MFELNLQPGCNVIDHTGKVYRVLDRELDIYFIALVSGTDCAYYVTDCVNLDGLRDKQLRFDFGKCFASCHFFEAYEHYKQLVAEKDADLHAIYRNTRSARRQARYS